MQPQILNILDIMKDLVSVQSDTGTKMEENMAERIAAYFREDSYLSAHPDHWGLAETNDFLGRRVVWALKEGTSRKTLILTGHYDAVEIDCYGELKPLALKPEALREEMLRQKLLRPLEKLSGKGHIATSLLRSADVSDWDYAIEAHKEWHNTFDKNYTSTDSFYELYELAAHEAVDMIDAFMKALNGGASMEEITQDRGFSSDLPGVYGE